MSFAIAQKRSGMKHLRVAKPPIRTRGRVTGETAWVYLGANAAGRLKIGMTGQPERRCRGLRIRLIFAQECVLDAARLIETEALRILGHRQGDGEWTFLPAADAKQAILDAYERIGRGRRVSPYLTMEQDRLRRVALMRSSVEGDS